MALITKGLNDFRYHSAVQTVAKQLLKGQCVFFLGPARFCRVAAARLANGPPGGRVCRCDAKEFAHRPGALSQFLAAECKLDWHDYIPLSTIAFYYESVLHATGAQ